MMSSDIWGCDWRRTIREISIGRSDEAKIKLAFHHPSSRCEMLFIFREKRVFDKENREKSDEIAF